MRDELKFLLVLAVFAAIMWITWVQGGITVFWTVCATIVGTFIWTFLPENGTQEDH